MNCLNANIINRLVKLLIPLMGSELERKSLLGGALHGCPVLGQIEYAGPEESVVTSVVTKLYDFGTFNRQPALRMLLKQACTQVGDDKRSQFNSLIEQIWESEDPLYGDLLGLDYKQQEEGFRGVIDSQKVAAFLIHGLEYHGHEWLLNRLLHQHLPQANLLKICFKRRSRPLDVCTVWRDIGQQLGARRLDYDLGKVQPLVVARMRKSLETRPQVLAFLDVDQLPEGSLVSLLDEFWLHLSKGVQKDTAPSHHLLTFLVDFCTYVLDGARPLAERLLGCVGSPIALPGISLFSQEVLEHWIEDYLKSRTDEELLVKMSQSVEQILQQTQGIPERVLEFVCEEIYNESWFERKGKWLRL